MASLNSELLYEFKVSDTKQYFLFLLSFAKYQQTKVNMALLYLASTSISFLKEKNIQE